MRARVGAGSWPTSGACRYLFSMRNVVRGIGSCTRRASDISFLPPMRTTCMEDIQCLTPIVRGNGFAARSPGGCVAQRPGLPGFYCQRAPQCKESGSCTGRAADISFLHPTCATLGVDFRFPHPSCIPTVSLRVCGGVFCLPSDSQPFDFWF